MTTPTTARQFTVFGTLATALRIYLRNFVSFTLLSLIVYSPLIAYAIWGMNRAMDAPTKDEASNRGAVVVLVVFGATFLLSKVVAGAVAFGVFNQLRDTKVSLGSCITNGLRRLVPVLLTTIFLAILIGISTAMYILPGVIVTCLAYVAVPAAVVEGHGAWSAFTRSVGLVDRALWRVFVLLCIFIGLQFVGYWILVGILKAAMAPVTARICVTMGATMLFGAFDAVLSSVAYAKLRVDRDGIGVGELAAVFD
jgi:hypothetical protein